MKRARKGHVPHSADRRATERADAITRALAEVQPAFTIDRTDPAYQSAVQADAPPGANQGNDRQ